MTAEIYTVRNAEGQFAGTYRAANAKAAIAAFEREQAQYAATFRKSATRISSSGFTATVETK